MKRLMTFALAVLLSLGIVSVSLAQEEGGAAAPQAAGGEAQSAKTPKKHKKKHVRKHRKSKKKEGQAEEPMK